MAGRDVGRSRVDVLAIHLVGEKIKVVFLHQVANLVHLASGVEIARGVVGIANQYGPCSVVDQLFELLHFGQRETLLDGGGNGSDFGTGRDGKRHVVGIGRLGHYNLIAGIEAAQESK